MSTSARAWLRRRWWIGYLLLLAASHASRFLHSAPAPPPPGVHFATVPAMRDDAPVARGTLRLAYLRWNPPRPSILPPVILLHGSPGGAFDFNTLGPMLARQGRTVIAVDQPGFGYSLTGVVDRSMRTAAHAVLDLMTDLTIDRAHIVGWSNGGGTALNIADLAPQRVESLTLLASIGAQETEGSGGYAFEHFKYAAGYILATAARELVPHFGLLDGLSFIQGSMLNFWDSDQRPLEAIMRRLTVPTLILHGRDDFLVPVWAAERHHQLIPQSRLVILPASHFIPFLQAEQATLHLTNFFMEAERGEGPNGELFDLAPDTNPLRGFGERADRIVRAGPWWAALVVIAGAALAAPLPALAVAGYFIGRHQLDPILAMTGILLGLAAESGLMWALGRWLGHRASRLPIIRRRVAILSGRVSELDWSRRFGLVPGGPKVKPFRLALASIFQPWAGTEMPLAAGALRFGPARLAAGWLAGALLWAIGMTIAASLLSAQMAAFAGGRLESPWSYAATIAGIVFVIPILNLLQHALTWIGRRRLRAGLSRTVRYEFWPAWAFYLPLVPWLLWLALRHRGLLTFSCCNPGIEGGGGIIGESKARIMANLRHAPACLPETHLIDAGPTPQERTLQVRRLLESRPALRGRGTDGFPVILKPDSGQRGHAVRLARADDDVLAYFHDMTRPAVLQHYHPGPNECGVLWSRALPNPKSAIQNPKADSGLIFSITRKEFPVITGDGRRTLEELVYRHSRLRCQSRVFFTRFADDRSRVLRAGEHLRLAVAGNHCQGTFFLDGADLATPALAAAIDAIARAFPVAPGGPPGGLDFGRFDLRYDSDEALKAGRGFAIVELNGTTSESTNLYDPTKNILWAYRILFRQWATLYRLGEARRRAGVRPITFRELGASLRTYFRARPGSGVSD